MCNYLSVSSFNQNRAISKPTAGLANVLMPFVSDLFLLTLMVSALFCADRSAPEKAMAQMMVIIFSSLSILIFVGKGMARE